MLFSKNDVILQSEGGRGGKAKKLRSYLMYGPSLASAFSNLMVTRKNVHVYKTFSVLIAQSFQLKDDGCDHQKKMN